MTFEEYLISKKIDSAAFRAAEPDRWNEWNNLFPDLSTASFTSQKLFLINPIRRKYQLKDSPPEQKQAPEVPPVVTNPAEANKPKVAKPVFKPKIS